MNNEPSITVTIIYLAIIGNRLVISHAK